MATLLQEQDHYRAEVRMFDAHFFRVLLSYATGLIAAFGWLGAQVLERSAQLVQEAAMRTPPVVLPLGQASQHVFSELSDGPFFYLFSGVPAITALMFLFVARDWTSLNEKFNLLKGVSDRIAAIVAGESCPSEALLRLDRGFKNRGQGLRRGVESTLFVFWFAAALTLSVIILLDIHKFADGTARELWFWFAGCFGLLVGIGSLLTALIAFRKRAYQEKPRGAHGNPVEDAS